jgi:hypothetical protein
MLGLKRLCVSLAVGDRLARVCEAREDRHVAVGADQLDDLFMVALCGGLVREDDKLALARLSGGGVGSGVL